MFKKKPYFRQFESQPGDPTLQQQIQQVQDSVKQDKQPQIQPPVKSPLSNALKSYLTNDSVKIIQDYDKSKDDKMTLVSFACIPFTGIKGAGKTTRMNQMLKNYVDIGNMHEYNIEQPRLLNGPFTHFWYFCQSDPTQDDTLKQYNDGRIYVKAEDEQFEKIYQLIIKMHEIIPSILQFETDLRNIVQDKLFMKLIDNDIHNQLDLRIFSKIIKLIEKTKRDPDFKELLVKDTNPVVIAGMNKLYNKLGVKYDQIFIRRQKIAMCLDDSGTMDIFKSARSNFYKLVINARHWSVFCLLFALHSVANQTKQIRESYTQYCIFTGMESDRQKQLYRELCLGSKFYTVDMFVDQYQKITGLDKYRRDQKPGDKYNFMYLIRDPGLHIYKNWNLEIFEDW